MQIRTSLLPEDRPVQADVAVIIDVLRATSVMATALAAGARNISTCREVDAARSLAEKTQPRPLLCGERGCLPIDGFDLGNSPADYTPDRVSGRSLIMTTTNGTRAIDSVAGAARILTASFLNITTVVDALSTATSVHLVCAGTEGEVTAEDVLLAGAILGACHDRFHADWPDDTSTLAHQLWRSWFPNVDAQTPPDPAQLSRRLRETRGGRNLARLGLAEDLDRCAAWNSLTVVPEQVETSPATFALKAK